MPWGSPVVLPREPENPWSAALRQLTTKAALQHMQNVQSTRASEAQRAFEKEKGELDRASREQIAKIGAGRSYGTTPQILQLMAHRDVLKQQDPEHPDLPMLDDAIRTQSLRAAQFIPTSTGYLMADPSNPKNIIPVQQPQPGQEPGQPALPVSADPGLAYKMKTAETKAKVEAGEEITPKAKKYEGQQRVSSILGELNNIYKDLDKKGAIVSTERTTAENIKARVAASGVGQAAGRAVGTEEQVLRDQINQMRPLLINHIRQASEMGARGLDSNKELDFYLQAATDPARSIEVNLKAIEVLNGAYGAGSQDRKNISIPGVPPGARYVGVDKETGSPVYEYQEKLYIPEL